MSLAWVLVLGVLVIPFALGAVLNAYGALTVDGALQMFAAAVAGQTIAVLSAIAATVLAVKRHYALPALLAFVLITAVVALFAVGHIETAGDLLLSRLERAAEVVQLNN
jgi:hypothetical protein